MNELNPQMFQHLLDPFGICQGRVHQLGATNMLVLPVLPAQLGTSQVKHFSAVSK